MTDRLARALGVFFAFPLKGDRDVYGVHQRVSMLIEGLGRIAKRVDLLFYVGADAPLEGIEVNNAVTRLGRRVAAEVRVELCRRARVPVTGLSRRHYLTRFLLPGSVSVHRQPAFASFNGPEQVAALERVLGHRPELVLVHDSRTMATVPPRTDLCFRFPLGVKRSGNAPPAASAIRFKPWAALALCPPQAFSRCVASGC